MDYLYNNKTNSMTNENKIPKKRTPKKKVWVPKVMDLTLTLEQYGLKIGDKVMLGAGPHEIVGFDPSKMEQVQLKPVDSPFPGTVRRNLHTAQKNLIKE